MRRKERIKDEEERGREGRTEEEEEGRGSNSSSGVRQQGGRAIMAWERLYHMIL